MHGRFKTLVSTLVESEKPDTLVIISHSQGTVISIEAIKAKALSCMSNDRCALVTMGSPYSHIYQHCFASDFTQPTDFDEHLGSWLNIFRIDDFVGTTVTSHTTDWPKNEPVNPKGHTGYWTDSEVLTLLRKNVLDEFGETLPNAPEANATEKASA